MRFLLAATVLLLLVPTTAAQTTIQVTVTVTVDAGGVFHLVCRGIDVPVLGCVNAGCTSGCKPIDVEVKVVLP